MAGGRDARAAPTVWPLVAGGRADMAQPGRPPGDTGQFEGVQHQRAELDFGAAAGAQAT